jgi:phospho-N-acetylmuramoyl-pentapeptide-transferase
MEVTQMSVDVLRQAIFFGLVSCALAFAWAPLMTKFLYKYNITRRAEFDPTLSHGTRKNKAGVPVMGGLLVVVTVAVLTYFFNWNRSFTWVPIGVMLMAATLGGIDDVLNIFGRTRRSRKLSQILRLIRVHKSLKMRIWYILTLPWSVFRRTSVWLSSHPGKGLHIHERLFFELAAGGITAWWIYYKLGTDWLTLHIPFDGFVYAGWFVIPLIIFFVVATANAVNIADGMDGLAGGSLTVTFAALALLSWLGGFEELTTLNLMVVGALLTYTYFNIKPARFQMGDVGTLGLGALVAINAIVINKMLFLPFLAFIFYLELGSVLIQIAGRYILGRRIFRMAPFHHHVELRGWSEEKTVMRFWVIHTAVVMLGIWVALL